MKVLDSHSGSGYSNGSSDKLLSMLNSKAPAARLLVVTMHLPVSLEKEEGGKWKITRKEGNVVGDALRALQLEEEIEYLSIGWVGQDIPVEEQDALTSDLMINHHCYPIYLTDTQAEDFYHRFCKGVLWPTMNYSLANSRRFQGIEHLWLTYKKIMAFIAESVATLYRPGDVIWIHDYHLMCLPAYIRQRLPVAKIGFFMHCTFPSSELFRQIPIRESILIGLCKADVIGFQTYNYCRYFLRSISILLDWEYGPTSVIDPSGKVTRVHVDPTGLTVDLIDERLRDPLVADQAESWRRSIVATNGFGTKIIVGRCNRFDKYQGIVEKLLAFDHFLSQHPEWIEKVILIQSVIDNESFLRDQQQEHSSNNNNTQNQVVHEERLLLVERVEELVGRINGSHGTLGWQPIHIHIKSQTSIINCLALDRLADVVMITPTRDGMNLIAHESALATQQKHAPLILSEFAGAASCLGGSVIVNPYDKNSMSDAIEKALLMPEDDKKRNHDYNIKYVRQNTVARWARTCIHEVIRDDNDRFGRRNLKDPTVLSELMRLYESSQSRLIFLDQEGLDGHKKVTGGSAMIQFLLPIINDLADDPKNNIYIVTGRDKNEFESIDSSILKKIGICSQHGQFTKRPNKDNWEASDESIDLGWKEPVKTLFDDFCERTPGTSVFETDVSLSWLYRKADQGFARWLVKDLLQVLHQVADKYPISILMHSGSLEVRPRNLSKASACRGIATRFPAHSIFCIGSADYELHDLSATETKKPSSPGKQSVEVVKTVIVGEPTSATKADYCVGKSGMFSFFILFYFILFILTRHQLSTFKKKEPTKQTKQLTSLHSFESCWMPRMSIIYYFSILKKCWLRLEDCSSLTTDTSLDSFIRLDDES